jgi:arabinose-5-phosphate isomerase
MIAARPGRVVVCGMGKSGLIGRKIAATLSSTGTPAFFLHASEALHGDLGMVTTEDTVVMISNSGETAEVIHLLVPLRDMCVPVIAMTGNGRSTLARKADVFLDISVEREACPLNLAPTTSTLVTLALGDAMAMALSQLRGFEAGDFARCHPGGSLGRRLSTLVSDIMRTDNLPFVRPSDPMKHLVMTMTEGRCGTALVMENEELVGVITDGDLRRAFQKSEDCLSMTAAEIMTRAPLVIREDARLSDAEELMSTKRIKVLVAVDPAGKVRGVVEMYLV